jgi:tetratricopeptide (TPR) repeat protein
MRLFGRLAGRSILALAIVAALGVGLVTWGGPVKRQLAEWMKTDASRVADAAGAYEKGDWERAAELARPLLKGRADNSEALRIFARASARMEHDTTAAAIYAGRLDSSLLQSEDYLLLGLLNARARRFSDALAVWDKAARQGDDNPELLDNVAKVSAALKRLDEAAEAARRLSKKPGWEARGLMLLGEILAKLDDPKGSADALREAFKRDPGGKDDPFPLPQSRKRFARSLLQLGQPAEATQALEAIRAKGGWGGALDPESEWLLSRARLQEGNLKEASSALERAGPYRADNLVVPEPSPYVGGATCVACHREESRNHEKSRHARTFHHGRRLLDLPFPDRPLADPDDPKVTHNFRRDQDRITVDTRAGDKVYQVIVEYAFGISDQYVTMIGRDEERNYRALRLSSYHTAEGVAWGQTSGDVPDTNSVDNIRGEPIHVRDGVVRCLYCHVTFYRDFRDPPPELGRSAAAADAAIGCERCHGPGGNHVKAIKGNFKDSAIMNAGTGGASAIGTLCADCHIVGAPEEIKSAPEDPRYVRSPGITLTFSRCFSESEGGLSCLTCHDAHRDDQGPALFYEKQCLSCHSEKPRTEKPAGALTAGASSRGVRPNSVCPVNPASKCLECHMPKVPIAALHRDLTDHYIRVHDRSRKN